jgi:hypothetical protein
LIGDRQGTLKTGAAGLRVIMHIEKENDGSSKAALISIDQGSDGRGAFSSIDAIRPRTGVHGTAGSVSRVRLPGSSPENVECCLLQIVHRLSEFDANSRSIPRLEQRDHLSTKIYRIP